MERLSKSINVLNDVAMGRRKADLVLDGCSLVSVYTGEIVPDTQVAVVNGRIAYVGSDASHTIGSKTKTIHLGGKYLVPGFADPHTHIDQFVMPQYLAEKSLFSHGTIFLQFQEDLPDIVSAKSVGSWHEIIQRIVLRSLFVTFVQENTSPSPTVSELRSADFS